MKKKLGDDRIRQAIVVRKDLKMGCGKIAGQVAHASLRAFWDAEEKSVNEVIKWVTDSNETKVVLKVRSEDELHDVIEKCLEMDVPHALVYDAGRTQIEPNTLTAVGIGPCEDEVIDEIVGDLKLL